jgi:hypothetical protein
VHDKSGTAVLHVFGRRLHFPSKAVKGRYFFCDREFVIQISCSKTRGYHTIDNYDGFLPLCRFAAAGALRTEMRMKLLLKKMKSLILSRSCHHGSMCIPLPLDNKIMTTQEKRPLYD